MPKSTKVIIIEPLFKVFADGTHGIRVDNPNEVIFGSELPLPKFSDEYKDKGGQAFQDSQLYRGSDLLRKVTGTSDVIVKSNYSYASIKRSS